MACQMAVPGYMRSVQTHVATGVASTVVLVVTGSAGASSSTTATTRSTASSTSLAGVSRVAVLADTVLGGLGSVVLGTCASITECCGGMVSVGGVVGELSTVHVLPCSEPVKAALRPPRPPAAGLGASVAGASAPALRLPARWTGLSMTLVGGSGSLLGSSSRSLPE
jgi:hypothetical protein